MTIYPNESFRKESGFSNDDVRIEMDRGRRGRT